MNRWVGAVVLPMVLTAVFPSRTAENLSTFFEENIGLKDSQIADIEAGQAVVKILDSPKPSQVFVFGVIAIRAQPASYVKLAGDLDRLQRLPSYLAIRRFSDPPELSDLSGFAIDNDDVAALKKCEPGDCAVQLPEENIEEFKNNIDWSGSDPGKQVNELVKKMALETLLAYQKGGNTALGMYRDKKEPAQVSTQFQALLSQSKFLPEKLPQFYSYLLDYPNALLPGSSSFFFWEKVKFGLKPTLRINQQISARLTAEHRPIDVVAIKQLYASHYFQTALDLYFCVPRDPDSFYLITLKGSEQAGLTGIKGGTMKKIALGKMKSSLERSLQAIKVELEK